MVESDMYVDELDTDDMSSSRGMLEGGRFIEWSCVESGWKFKFQAVVDSVMVVLSISIFEFL